MPVVSPLLIKSTKNFIIGCLGVWGFCDVMCSVIQ